MKTFLLRNVPEEVHAQWSHFSRLHGQSMRSYIIAALIQKVERDKIVTTNNEKEDENVSERD